MQPLRSFLANLGRSVGRSKVLAQYYTLGVSRWKEENGDRDHNNK
jgi:hypothetical protein